jgi:hypothetical protein
VSFSDTLRQLSWRVDAAMPDVTLEIDPQQPTASEDWRNKKKPGARFKLYQVMYKGVRIGYVMQARESVAREIKGRRYVAGYSYPLRWIAKNGHLYRNTRAKAVRDMVEDHLRDNDKE